ncbi:tubulin-specific chaperone C [Brienomyrus brachyistius]|uniref:tubulin-specific chaperone C n=1 Tax=Brienomyrus brachyistius TaxID=42636 RepID=UPI0020B401A5|nr:tubulin-specific chaperone C [Brienomyrus brachyistius]
MEALVLPEDGSHKGNGDTVKVPDRLLKREQVRQEEAERRKEAKESKSVAEEKIDYFSNAFGTERAAVEELLSGCSAENGGATAAVLEEVSSRIQRLQKFLNDSMSFLTQYELRQAQASLQKLQGALAYKRDEVMPKKRFAFRSRNSAPSKSKLSSALPVQAAVEEGGSTAVGIGVDVAAQCGFSNVSSQVLSKGPDEIRKRDVLLTQLTNCRVRLYGAPSTLHIKHVRDSEIMCGPVSGSVFVDDCSGCTLALPCQQLRTHNTCDTRVYLHVTSRAIVEDCTGVSFAPFSWTYPALDADFEASGLDKGRNNWSQVDDFNWLAADTPSPNWTLIPESERRTSWD